MKQGKWWLCGLAVLLLTLSPALAAEEGAADKAKQERKRRAKRPPRGRRGRQPQGSYAQMIKECKLDEAQQAKLKAVLAEFKTKEDAWKEANGTKVKELNQGLREARKAKDKAKMSALNKEMAPLRKQQAELKAEKDKAVQAILTPEQKELWRAFTLYRSTVGKFRRAELTEEQKAKVKALCAPAAKKLAAVDAKDRKKRGVITKELQEKITKEVLTEEQRKKMDTKPAKGDRPKGEKRAKKGKADKPAE